ncbi:MAG TPA: histidine phosphatase family protein [Polyangia bacterium]
MNASTERLTWGQHVLDAVTHFQAGLAQPEPAAILIRHSVREPLLDMATADAVPLTPEGEEAARALGRRLPRARRLRVWHSPVGRCAMTAHRVAEGFREAGGAVDVDGVLPILGGPYVRDVAGMVRLVGTLGARYARAWFDGEVPDSVMAPRDQVARQIVGVVADLVAAAAPDALLVLVTHDWNVMLVRESILGITHEEVGWLDYLDGLLVTRAGDGVDVDWHGRAARVPATAR